MPLLKSEQFFVMTECLDKRGSAINVIFCCVLYILFKCIMYRCLYKMYDVFFHVNV